MLSVVIPVFNRSDMTDLVLKGLWFTASKEDEIIVVNNGSTDTTGLVLFEHQKQFGTRMRVIRHEQNFGFATACNHGIKASRGTHIILMNNDIEIKAVFQRQIVEALDENPKRLVCTRIVDWQAGWNQFGDMVIPYAEGWCLGFTRQFIEDVGYFDEQFSPAYYEDVDLSFRALQKGYALHRLDLPIRHIGMQSSSQLKDPVPLTEEHRKMFAKKWGLKC